jgi:hypothetical protein
MKEVALRVESSIPQRLRDLHRGKGDTSEILRRLVRLGVEIKEAGGYYIQTPLSYKIPLEDLTIGSEEGRLHFFIDEELLQKAHNVFLADDQVVIKKALRLAFWRLQNLSDPEKTRILYSDQRETTRVDNDTLLQILEFLEPENKEKVLVLVGNNEVTTNNLISRVFNLLRNKENSRPENKDETSEKIKRLSSIYDLSNEENPVTQQIIKNYVEQTLEKDAIKVTRSLFKEKIKSPDKVALRLIDAPNLSQVIKALQNDPKLPIKYITHTNLKMAEKLKKEYSNIKIIKINNNVEPKIIELKLI